jgi:GNAT superfamily N-acetyltransferase
VTAIRPLAPGDLAGLGWLDDGTREGLGRAVAAGSDGAVTLVAEDGGTPTGVVAVDLPQWRGRTAPWLWLLEVCPPRRGAGVGSALLVAAHAALAARGHGSVELSVAEANPRARALYERAGYGATGSGTDPGDDGPEPWTRMRRRLLNR